MNPSDINLVPPIYIAENGDKWWPRLVTVTTVWSYLLTILQVIHVELLFSKALLHGEHDQMEGNLRTDVKCRFGRYIDDLFVLGTDQNTWCIYMVVFKEHSSGRDYPPSCRRASDSTKIKRLKSSEWSLTKRDRLSRIVRDSQTYLAIPQRCFKNCLCNIRKLQELLGYWNWFPHLIGWLFPYSKYFMN